MFKIIVFLSLFFISLITLFQDEIHSYRNIVLGASLPKTGIIKEWGNSVLSGANSYFKYTNDNNIIKNKKIHLVSYDDKYEPELTKINTNKLINEDKIFALFGFVGTPTVKKILPELEDSKIPFLAPFTGASFLREINLPNIINIRSNYFQEIEEIINYLYTNKNFKKFAVFYQNDDYGEEGYTALLEILKKKNLTLAAEGSYKRNTLSIAHALNEIKYSNPEAIIMVGAYKANALFIKKARQEKSLKDTLFATISFGDANAMIKELKNDSKNLLFSQVVPSYSDTSIPVIKEYQEVYKKYYPKNEFSFISLEAYLGAKIVVNAINNIDGSITKNKFLESMKTLEKNTLDGIDIKFKNNQLLNKTYLFEYKDSNFKEIKYENR